MLQVGSRFVDIPGIMAAMPLNEPQSDDPRKLRALLDKVVNLADDHHLTSVLVGMAGPDGDLIFPEVVDFVGSALRIDDAIFRMTRNRAVLFLADADRARAEEIMERVIDAFAEQFAIAEESSCRDLLFRSCARDAGRDPQDHSSAPVRSRSKLSLAAHWPSAKAFAASRDRGNRSGSTAWIYRSNARVSGPRELAAVLYLNGTDPTRRAPIRPRERIRFRCGQIRIRRRACAGGYSGDYRATRR